MLITDATREKTEGYIKAVFDAANEYNSSGKQPPIAFAAGYALSEEHPELSRKKLFEEADRQMYENKKQWYTDNNITH